MAATGPRALLLLLLIALVLECESQSAKKPKPCRYNGKKYAAGEAIVTLAEACVELRCSDKGKKMELGAIEGCSSSSCKEVTEAPKATDPPKPKTDAPSSAEKCDYSSFPSTHTMKLPSNKDCDYHKSGVSADDIKTILRTHNELRAKVANGKETQGSPGPQPGATNMREMRWNPQLAEVAQAWAEQCPNGHDSYGNRKICDPNYAVGQNIYWKWSFDPSPVWEDAIGSWYGEVKDMPASLVDSFGSHPSGKVIGHYTQVVWAGSYEVGCGAVYYSDTRGGTTYPESKAYVCNYGPAGNFRNSKIYEKGAAASNCPDGTSSDYPGLCAAPPS